MNSPLIPLIVAAGSTPLTAAQRKFNNLVRKIEQARAELLAWQEQVPVYVQGHAQRIRPLLEEIDARRREVIDRLDALLAQPKAGWTNAQRQTMREFLCEEAADLIESENIDDAEAERLTALHDKHADVDLDAQNREGAAVMKEMFEAMSGLDLGDETFETEDELMQRVGERMHAERETQAEAREREATAAPRPHRKTAAQRRRETEAQEASQSLREVYRKLASALHPDRASDAADHASRTALMKRVNQAYDAKDLLALFALQLEIEQVDAAHIAKATAERARHYNQVLEAQLADLQAELEMRRTAFCVDFDIDPFENPRAQQLGKLLDREVAEWRAALAATEQDLRQLADPAGARRWVKRVRRQQQAFEDDLF